MHIHDDDDDGMSSPPPELCRCGQHELLCSKFQIYLHVNDDIDLVECVVDQEYNQRHTESGWFAKQFGGGVVYSVDELPVDTPEWTRAVTDYTARAYEHLDTPPGHVWECRILQRDIKDEEEEYTRLLSMVELRADRYHGTEWHVVGSDTPRHDPPPPSIYTCESRKIYRTYLAMDRLWTRCQRLAKNNKVDALAAFFANMWCAFQLDHAEFEKIKTSLGRRTKNNKIAFLVDLIQTCIHMHKHRACVCL